MLEEEKKCRGGGYDYGFLVDGKMVSVSLFYLEDNA